MKKLSILLVIGFVLILLFSFDVNKVFAQSTTWTASNVTFNVKITKVVTNKQNVQSLQAKTHPFTGTITLFTDNRGNGDPTAGDVPAPADLAIAPPTTQCFIGIVGTLDQNNPITIYICISDLVNVSADKAKGAGENAMIVGTGEIVTSTDTGLVFLKAKWQETDVSGLPTSISLMSGKLDGGSEPLFGATESTGSIFSVSLPAIKFSK